MMQSGYKASPNPLTERLTPRSAAGASNASAGPLECEFQCLTASACATDEKDGPRNVSTGSLDDLTRPLD